MDKVEPLLCHKRSWNAGEKTPGAEGASGHWGAMPRTGPDQVVSTR